MADQELAGEHRQQADCGRDEEKGDQARGEPVVLLTAVEAELEGTDAHRQQADSPVVDAC